MNNDKLTLVEALAQLKEDGSNYAVLVDVGFKNRFYLSGERLFFEKAGISGFWEEDRVHKVPLDGWQIVHEPKFKVGDLVMAREICYGNRYGTVIAIDGHHYKLSFDGNHVVELWRAESTLTLILTAEELKAKE